MSPPLPAYSNANAWQVLSLFLIPIGGGIPAGVILAQTRGIAWPITTGLYLISDVILACLFEPILRLLLAASRRFLFLTRLKEILKKSMESTLLKPGVTLGPFALVMVAFGADPMTGRAATLASGHGFLAGWILAILGDMLYFMVIMTSTLWLNRILGDGTWTTLIILGLMILGPYWVRRFRERRT